MPSDEQKKADDEAFKLATRQLTTGLTLLSKLVDIDYALFRNQIERIAYQFSWHDSILDHTVAASATVRNSVKYKEDVRNAYVLLTDRTDGHEVADVLRDVPLGEAQQGWRELHEHYHRQTHGGQEEVENIFNSATMGTTATTFNRPRFAARRRTALALKPWAWAEPGPLRPQLAGWSGQPPLKAAARRAAPTPVDWEPCCRRGEWQPHWAALAARARAPQSGM